jgi:hypothetical protein
MAIHWPQHQQWHNALLGMMALDFGEGMAFKLVWIG